MPFPVRCPNCEHPFRVPDKFAGRRGKCPKCKSVFVAQPPDDAADDAAAKTAAKTTNGSTATRGAASTNGAAANSAGEQAAAGGMKTVSAPQPRILAQAKTKTPTADEVKPPPAPAKVKTAPGDSNGVVSAPPKSAPPKTASAEIAELSAPISAPLEFDLAAGSGAVSSTTAKSGSYVKRSKRTNPMMFLAVSGAVLVLLLAVGGVAAWSYLQGDSLLSSAAGSASDANDDAAKSTGDADKGPAKWDAPAPPPDEGDPFAGGTAAPALENWDDLRKSIVEITVIDRQGETHTGHGIVVDERGWVATTFALIDGARDATVKLPGGESTDELGVLVRRPKYDLALLKIDSVSGKPLSDLSAISVNADWAPEWGEKVYIGGREEPLLTTISGAVPSDSLPAAARPRLPEALRNAAPIDFFVHQQRIADDLDGAPLLIHDGRLVGINIALGGTRKGYVVPGWHVAEMLRAADPKKVQPLSRPGPDDHAAIDPPPVDTTPFDPQAARALAAFEQVHQRVKELNWRPEDATQYAILQEFSYVLTVAAEVAAKLRPGQRRQAEQTIEAAVKDLEQKELPDEAEMLSVNRLAAAGLEQPLKDAPGLFAYGKCVLRPEDFGNRSFDGLPLFAFELLGSEKTVIIPIGENGREIAAGSIWLILGARDESGEMNLPDGESKAPVVTAKYLGDAGPPKSAK